MRDFCKKIQLERALVLQDINESLLILINLFHQLQPMSWRL